MQVALKITAAYRVCIRVVHKFKDKNIIQELHLLSKDNDHLAF